ncbi:hypothetical protein TRFO_13668 [Tritrichomonas foetus]|uniref:Uncharacterized protein n=1 Tax=Tritrichomonas foetus TaxID=1144522 RepID=A0A1J4KXE6_9EUKA|nr:hypothetical protein TRFO_13668 [Tritrichomonas foetus]|eukprot:OHT15850.1 hypothetical protein TRFO_13668 [Tritrichomonas foetus]
MIDETITTAQLKKLLESANDEIKKLEDERTSFQDHIKTEILKINDLIKKQESQIAKKALNEASKELEPLQEKIDLLTEKQDHYQLEIISLKEELVSIQSKTSEISTLVNCEQQEDNNNSPILGESNSIVDDLTKEIKAIKDDINNLKENNNSTSEVPQDNDRYLREYASLKKKVKKLKNMIEALNKSEVINDGNDADQEPIKETVPKLFVDLPTISSIQLVFRKQIPETL